MTTLLPIIQPYLGKKLEIDVNGSKVNLHIFDWQEIVQEDTAMSKQIQDMNEEEASNFLNENESKYTQIAEYFMGGESAVRSDNDEWIPFGLLGLDHFPENFAEINNQGLLLFDLTADDKNDPPIILSKGYEDKMIAKKFSELKIVSLQ